MSQQTYSDTNVVGTSLLVSVSDVLLNVIVGLLTGSTVVFAQSLQGFSDLITAVILYTGVRRSKRHADKKHPLGYGREIFFWVLIAGVIMFIGTGLFTVSIGLQQFREPGVLDSMYIAFAMLSFGFVSNLYAFKKSIKRLRGRQRKNIWRVWRGSSLIETKATFVVDFLGTASAAIGLVALAIYELTGDVRFDGLGAIMVGVTMMIAAAILVLDVRDLIVGKAVPDTINRKIRTSTLAHAEVEEILDLRTLYLGSEKLLILLEVHLNDTLTTNQIEKLIDRIRAQLKAEIPEAYHLQIEVETPDNEIMA